MSFDSKIEQIVKLTKFINNSWRSSRKDCLIFDWWDLNSDGAILCIDLTTKSVKIESWRESHHNGSEYGKNVRDLNNEEASKAVDSLLRQLKSDAEKFARARIIKQREDE